MEARTSACMGAESPSAAMKSRTVLRPGEIGKRTDAKCDQRKTQVGSASHTALPRIVKPPDPTHRRFYSYPNAAVASCQAPVAA